MENRSQRSCDFLGKSAQRVSEFLMGVSRAEPRRELPSCLLTPQLKAQGGCSRITPEQISEMALELYQRGLGGRHKVGFPEDTKIRVRERRGASRKAQRKVPALLQEELRRKFQTVPEGAPHIPSAMMQSISREGGTERARSKEREGDRETKNTISSDNCRVGPRQNAGASFGVDADSAPQRPPGMRRREPRTDSQSSGQSIGQGPSDAPQRALPRASRAPRTVQSVLRTER